MGPMAHCTDTPTRYDRRTNFNYPIPVDVKNYANGEEIMMEQCVLTQGLTKKTVSAITASFV